MDCRAEVVLLPVAGMIALVLASWIELVVSTWLGHPGAPTAILGAGPASRTLARLLLAQPAWGLKPVGFIADSPSRGAEGQDVAPSAGHDDAISSLPLLGTIKLGRPIGGFEVLLVPHGQHLPRDPETLYRLGAKQILVVSDLGEFATLGLKTRSFDQFIAWELTASRRQPAHICRNASSILRYLCRLRWWRVRLSVCLPWRSRSSILVRRSLGNGVSDAMASRYRS